MPSVIALIPARSGSKRIQGKNIRPLGGHPLMAYSIHAALESGIFREVVVSTDSAAYAEIAGQYGAYPLLRPAAFAADGSPDIEWVRHALRTFLTYDAFAILRPTSPFRTAETIRRAWEVFSAPEGREIDSLRAVELARQHPCKMWRVDEITKNLVPVMYGVYGHGSGMDYAHSAPTQGLPPIYVQNASLEIAWTRTVWDTRSIAGTRVRPFLTQGYEGFDLNREEDWMLAEALIARGLVTLPEVRVRKEEQRSCQ